MTGCRISIEDRNDPYFDGDDVADDPAMNGTDAERERFADILADIEMLAYDLYRNKNFKPDEDDFDAAVNLYNELRYHKRGAK